MLPRRACENREPAFRPTRWSVIARASKNPGTDAEAFAELYGAYAFPLYAFVRRKGHDADQASDVVQEFFVELLDGSLLRAADQNKGRFRSYLLGALKHFLSNQHDRERAKKRGGGTLKLSLDDAERRYGLEPAHDATPERLFERQWAMTVLDHVMDQLTAEYQRAGKHQVFHQLKDLLAGPLADRSYAQIAAELDISEGAVKVAVHRLRHRYREILISHIAQTVEDEAEVEDEIRHLYAAISGSA